MENKNGSKKICGNCNYLKESRGILFSGLTRCVHPTNVCGLDKDGYPTKNEPVVHKYGTCPHFTLQKGRN